MLNLVYNWAFVSMTAIVVKGRSVMIFLQTTDVFYKKHHIYICVCVYNLSIDQEPGGWVTSENLKPYIDEKLTLSLSPWRLINLLGSLSPHVHWNISVCTCGYNSETIGKPQWGFMVFNWLLWSIGKPVCPPCLSWGQLLKELFHFFELSSLSRLEAIEKQVYS